MKNTKDRIFLVVVLVLAFSASVIPVANAYIDAGSGSFIIQMVVGAALGVGLFLKVYWRKFVSLFKRNGSSNDEE